MPTPDRTTRAAFWLAGLLLVAAWPPAEERPYPCEGPVERSARGGHTREAACAGLGRPVRGPARLLFGLRLDLGSADAEALEALPGIGPVRAAAILAERARRPFVRVEDLDRVPGIGPRSVARLRDWVRVGPLSPRAGSR